MLKAYIKGLNFPRLANKRAELSRSSSELRTQFWSQIKQTKEFKKSSYSPFSFQTKLRV